MNSTIITTITTFPRTSKHCFHVFTEASVRGWNLYILLAVLTLAFVFILITNLLMIFGMIKVHKKLSVSKQLFVMLSISDLLTGITTVPCQFIMTVLSSKASCLLVAVQAFLNMFTPSVSMFLLLTITLMRYSSLNSSSKCAIRIRNQNFIVFTVSFEIASSMAFSLWYAFHISQTLDRYAHGAFLIFVSIFCISIIGMILIINVLLLKSLTIHHQNTTKSISKSNTERCQRKVTKTVLMISSTLVICYLPTIISFGVTSYFMLTNDNRIEYYHYVIPWSHVPLILNSGLNSLIYIMRNTKLKNYIRDLLHKGVFQPEVEIAISRCSSANVRQTTSNINGNVHLAITPDLSAVARRKQTFL